MIGSIICTSSKETLSEAFINAKEIGLDFVVLSGETWKTAGPETLKLAGSCGLAVRAIDTNGMFPSGSAFLCDEKNDVYSAITELCACIRGQGISLLFDGLLESGPSAGGACGGSFEEKLQRLAEIGASYDVKMDVACKCRYERKRPFTIRDMGLCLHKNRGAAVGIVADTYQMNIEESSIERTVVDWGRFIDLMYLRDNQGGAPGTGMLDFASILRAVNEANPGLPLVVAANEKAELRTAVSYIKEEQSNVR